MKFILICLVAWGIAGTGFAGTPSPLYVQSGFWDQVQEKWEVVKKNAVVYYEKYFGAAFDKSTAQRNVASVSLEQQNLERQKRAEQLPVYKTEASVTGIEKLKETKQKVLEQKNTQVVIGRQADPSLRKRKSGVATFDVYKVDKAGKKSMVQIPVIDIGVENQLEMKDFSLDLPVGYQLTLNKIRELDSPALTSSSSIEKLIKIPYEKTKGEVAFEKISLSFPKDITADKIKNLALYIQPAFDVVELVYVPLSQDELTLLKGLILTEYQDKCHSGVGLLTSIQNVAGEGKELRDYYMSSCLYKMGFYTEGTEGLAQVIRSNGKFVKNAIDLIVSDYKRELVPQISEALKVASSQSVSESSQSLYHYIIALGESMSQSWKGVLNHAVKVNEKSDKYSEAQYLASVAEYMIGDIKGSMDRQEKLLVYLDSKKIHPHIYALLKMNIGRAAYRNKQYKKAIESYKFINKDSPLWFQALIEQGWMQILAGDAPGAVGNMFSIQMPQFKDLYKPESYAVRAIGYLNICQYGDAKKTVEHLSKIYAPWISAMKKELNKQQYNYVFYNNVIKSLKTGESATDLPQPILKEMARHKDFLNVQAAINNKVDEESQYPFIHSLIEKDRQSAFSKKSAASAREKELDLKIKSASTEKDTIKFVSEWKAKKNFESELVDYYNYESKTLSESLNSYSQFSKKSKALVLQKKEDFKSTAGKIMKNRLLEMQKKLAKLIENNEFLTYEVYSGSGENIRYVSAGGEVKGTSSNRKVASVGNKGKLFLWDFDGEYWADEIGNYKSSLKNNCPNANNYQKVQ